MFMFTSLAHCTEGCLRWVSSLPCSMLLYIEVQFIPKTRCSWIPWRQYVAKFYFEGQCSTGNTCCWFLPCDSLDVLKVKNPPSTPWCCNTSNLATNFYQIIFNSNLATSARNLDYASSPVCFSTNRLFTWDGCGLCTYDSLLFSFLSTVYKFLINTALCHWQISRLS